MLSRFHLVPGRKGQTDGQTDGQTGRFAISISRVSIQTRDKKSLKKSLNGPAGIALPLGGDAY